MYKTRVKTTKIIISPTVGANCVRPKSATISKQKNGRTQFAPTVDCIKIFEKSLLPREKVATKLTDEGQEYDNANLNRCAYKTPHPPRYTRHLLLEEKAFIQTFNDTLP